MRRQVPSPPLQKRLLRSSTTLVVMFARATFSAGVNNSLAANESGLSALQHLRIPHEDAMVARPPAQIEVDHAHVNS